MDADAKDKTDSWSLPAAHCSAMKWKSPNSGASLLAKQTTTTQKHQYLYKVLLYSRNRSHLFLEYLICPCKMFGGTLGWPEQYTPAKGPCFLFQGISENRHQPILLSNQFNYPQEDKNHNASRLHYYSSFEISLPCTSMHLKSYCRGGCIWRHLHRM